MRPRERFALVALWHNAELIKRGVNYEYTVNCDWPSVQHCCRIVHWHLVNLNTVFQQHTFQLKTKVKISFTRTHGISIWRIKCLSWVSSSCLKIIIIPIKPSVLINATEQVFHTHSLSQKWRDKRPTEKDVLLRDNVKNFLLLNDRNW